MRKNSKILNLKIILVLSIVIISNILILGCLNRDTSNSEHEIIVEEIQEMDKTEDDELNIDNLEEEKRKVDIQTDNNDSSTNPSNSYPISDKVEFLNDNIKSNQYDLNIKYITETNFITHYPITFYLESVPSDSNITWELENVKYYGYEINYSFKTSDYHNICVTVKWNDEIKSDKIELPIKNNNLWVIGETSTFIDITKRRAHFGLEIFDGITIPSAYIYLNLTNVTGDYIIGVDIFDEMESDPDDEIGVLRSETIKGRVEDISFYWEISNKELFEYEKHRSYNLGYFIENLDSLHHYELTYEIHVHF